jgi:hypothetical protein
MEESCKRFYYSIIGLAVSTVIYSCQRHGSSIETLSNFSNSYELVLNDSVVIPVDSTTPIRGLMRPFIDHDSTSEMLVFLNERINSLQFYSLEDRTHVKTIHFQNEGPMGIGNVNGFYFESLDSIFLIDNYRYRISLVDQYGHLVRRYSLLAGNVAFNEQTLAPPILTEDAYSGLPTPGNEAQVERIDEYLFFRVFPSYKTEQEIFNKGKLIGRLHIKTGALNYFLHFPERYKKESFARFYLLNSMTINESGQLVFGFPAENKITVYNKEMEQVATHVAKSRDMENVKALPKENLERQEKTMLAVANPHYKHTLYDPYHKLYYRFVWWPVAYPANESGVRIRHKAIILNADFDQIGETLLPMGVSTDAVFVTKKGLFVHLIGNEDMLEFYKFLPKRRNDM